jgi:hypothetical protein
MKITENFISKKDIPICELDSGDLFYAHVSTGSRSYFIKATEGAIRLHDGVVLNNLAFSAYKLYKVEKYTLEIKE